MSQRHECHRIAKRLMCSPQVASPCCLTAPGQSGTRVTFSGVDTRKDTFVTNQNIHDVTAYISGVTYVTLVTFA